MNKVRFTKKKWNEFRLCAGIFFVLCFGAASVVNAEVRTVPAPAGEAAADGAYKVSVNGVPVDVYTAQSEFFEGDYYFASFDFSEKAEVKISSPSMNPKAVVLPESFGIQTKIDGGVMTFEAEKPFRVSVETNGRIKPLLLFGNALETDAPDAKDPNVVYFGPGIHRTGKISLTDNQTLYLAAGAVVKGCVYASGKNIVIRGRGILDGQESPRFQGPGRFMMDCKDCTNIEIRDIILRNPWSWTFVTWNCDGVLIDGVKICGSRMLNDDALDLVNTENAVVRNCFFRTQDDSIAIKGCAEQTRPCRNIRIENCQFWTDVANVFRIGYECETDGMYDIYATNIDVLHYSKNYRAPTEYWANTIVWLQASNGMKMENCHFENVTVYSDGSDMILLIARPMCCKYGKIQNPEPGTIRSCSLKNVRVVGETGGFHGTLFLEGANETQCVDGISFENVEYFGRPISKDSPCVQIGPNVQNVNFR